MKITYLHQYFNTPKMAGSTRSYEMAKRLVAKGHQVSIVTSWRGSTDRVDWFTTEETGIHVHWLPNAYGNAMRYEDRVRAFMRFAWNAAGRAAAIASDVVLASSTPLTIALPGAYAAWRLAVPMVFEVRDLWPEVPIAIGAIRSPPLKAAARALERFAYWRSRRIIALSPGMRDGVARTGYPPGSIVTIPNAADLDRFGRDDTRRRAFRERHGISSQAVLVAYVGTLGKVNGVGYLARVAGALRSDRRVQFITVGGGQELQSVKSLALELGCLNENFHMLPEVPKEDVPEVLAASDIAVSTIIPLPELEANSANKFFDGLAAGCCIAVNHGGWQAELLASHGAGFRLPASPDEGASELAKWVGDPRRIAEAGLAARRLAEAQFGRDKLADDLEQVLLQAVGREAPSSAHGSDR